LSNGGFGNITAFYSDERLKEITKYVSDVLPILSIINMFRYDWNDLAASYGYDKNKKEIASSAQKYKNIIQKLSQLLHLMLRRTKKVMKLMSKTGENYLTLDYWRLVPVLLRGIKDLDIELNDIKTRFKRLEM